MDDLRIASQWTPEFSPRREIAPATPETRFADTLQGLWNETERLQDVKDRAVHDLTSLPTPDLHNTMIDIQQAEISFKLMMQIRNKIVSAYEEIMRMNI